VPVLYGIDAVRIRFSGEMKKKTRKATKNLTKSVRKAVKRHSIATGVLTGAATAMALSGTGATRKVSTALGNGVAGLLKARQGSTEVLSRLRQATAEALVRAGHAIEVGENRSTPASNGKASTPARRSAARTAA